MRAASKWKSADSPAALRLDHQQTGVLQDGFGGEDSAYGRPTIQTTTLAENEASLPYGFNLVAPQFRSLLMAIVRLISPSYPVGVQSWHHDSDAVFSPVRKSAAARLRSGPAMLKNALVVFPSALL